MQSRLDEKMFNDIFRDPTEDEIQAQKKQLDEAAKEVEAVGKMARECVNTDKFQYYKQAFEKAKNRVIDMLINYKASDITTYGIQVMSWLDKIRYLKSLVDIVEYDARKGKE